MGIYYFRAGDEIEEGKGRKDQVCDTDDEYLNWLCMFATWSDGQSVMSEFFAAQATVENRLQEPQSLE